MATKHPSSRRYPPEVKQRAVQLVLISHRHTGVRSPTTTGKIERFHQSLRKEFLAERTFESARAAQDALDAWVVDYNTQRPHQALNSDTERRPFAYRSLEGEDAG